MAEFASHALGTAGLTTGIIGTVGAAAQFLGGGFGGGWMSAPRTGGVVCGTAAAADAAIHMDDHFVTSKEMFYIQQLNEERFKNAILISEQASEIKMADIYERLAKKINDNQREQDAVNREQAVYNSVNKVIVRDIRRDVDELLAFAPRKISNDSITPGWGEVEVTPVTP